MSQSPTTNTPHSPILKLAGLPQSPLSPSQQLEAIKRTQDQADKRVKLGMQLYRAAEQHTAHQRSLLDEFKQEQQQLKDELHEDMARSLHSYDQWVGKVDEDFTKALKHIENRIDDLQEQWAQSRQRIDTVMQRSETLLDQSRLMVSSASKALTSMQRSAAGFPQARSPAEKVQRAGDHIKASADQAATNLSQAIAEVKSVTLSPQDTPAPPNTSDTPTDTIDQSATFHRQSDHSATRLYRDIIDKMNRSTDKK